MAMKKLNQNSQPIQASKKKDNPSIPAALPPERPAAQRGTGLTGPEIIEPADLGMVFDQRSILQGIIFNEILGPPKGSRARRR